ncbi:MAG: M23 family metallopeptidase [Solirubrobacterales bacterium]
MSSFNSQYEEYYSKVNKGVHEGWRGKGKKSMGRIIAGRFIKELTGTLILFIFAITCKVVQNPETQAVYKYSKATLSRSYDYNQIKNSILYWKDKFENRIPDIEKFIKPVQGVITSNYGYRTDPVKGGAEFHEGEDISVKENTDVAAVYNGKVKSLGEDDELGKFIILDHGNGAESKYAHLNEILVSKEDAVKKGDIIAKSGNTGKSTGPHLHFELLYMGKNVNPEVIK